MPGISATIVFDHGNVVKLARYASELLCKTNSLMDGASVSLQPGTRSAVGAQ
ncbi:hypothetical protein MAHJHV50_50590 [Mycobacterium avium subsp. hominissuis]